MKHDQCLCLVKKPFTLQQFTNLFEVKKYWIVQLICVALNFSVLEKNQIFWYDAVFCNNWKLRNLVEFTLLKHWFIDLLMLLSLLSFLFFIILFSFYKLFSFLIRFLTIFIIFIILRNKVIFTLFLFFLVFSFQQLICLYCQYFSISVSWKKFIKLMTNID